MPGIGEFLSLRTRHQSGMKKRKEKPKKEHEDSRYNEGHTNRIRADGRIASGQARNNDEEGAACGNQPPFISCGDDTEEPADRCIAGNPREPQDIAERRAHKQENSERIAGGRIIRLVDGDLRRRPVFRVKGRRFFGEESRPGEGEWGACSEDEPREKK